MMQVVPSVAADQTLKPQHYQPLTSTPKDSYIWLILTDLAVEIETIMQLKKVIAVSTGCVLPLNVLPYNASSAMLSKYFYTKSLQCFNPALAVSATVQSGCRKTARLSLSQHSWTTILFVDVTSKAYASTCSISCLFVCLYVCRNRATSHTFVVILWVILAHAVGLFNQHLTLSVPPNGVHCEQGPPVLCNESIPALTESDNTQCHFQQGRHSLSARTANTFVLQRATSPVFKIR